MKKLMLLTGLLTIMPVMAHAEMCVDFDDDMNVIEYDCSKSLDDLLYERTNKATKSMNIFIRGAYGMHLSESSAPQENDNSIYGSVGMRFFGKHRMFYDLELAGEYMSMESNVYDTCFEEIYGYNVRFGYNYTLDANVYHLMINAHIGYNFKQKVFLYSGFGIGHVQTSGDSRTKWGAGHSATDTEHSNGYLVRLLLGTEYEIGHGFALFGEYAYTMRYVDISDIDTENYMHTLFLGAKYSF